MIKHHIPKRHGVTSHRRPRILVTGACGFIGGHFVEEALKTTDAEIIALAGLTYASNPDPILGLDRVTAIYHDLRKPIPDAIREKIGAIDYIVNFAADSHVDRSLADPIPFVQNNVEAALHVFEFARTAKPRSVLQISTDEVYGPAPAGYSHKEWDPAIPSNPYSASKASQEAIAMAWWRSYNVPVIITNTMNNFGQRQHPEKFVPKIVKAIQDGTPITIHAQPPSAATWQKEGVRLERENWIPGSRVWIHAADHADGLLWILANKKPLPYGETDRPTRFNVCGTEEIDNFEMAVRIAAMLDRENDLQIEFQDFHESRPGHDLRYSLDGSLLAKEGWEPRRSLDESLAETVKELANRR